MKYNNENLSDIPIDIYGAVGNIANTDEEHFLRQYIVACEMMSRCLNHVIYVGDYRKQEFAYVSAVPSMLFGLTPRSIINRGFNFLNDYLNADDLLFIRNIVSDWFIFLENCPKQHINSYVLSYNIELKSSKYGELLISNSLIPLRFESNGHPWLVHGTLSMATDHRPHIGRIGLMGQTSYWEYDEQQRIFNLIEVPPLSEASKRIIYLSHLGHTVEEIAKRMRRTESTIKWYRCVLKRQFHTLNFEQVIAIAKDLKLLWS